MDSKVTFYIQKQKYPQKEICKKIRRLILKTFPKIKEEIKMGVPWYECRYYIVGLRDSVNLGFSVKNLTKKQQDLFKGKGKFMRHLKFHSLKDVDEKSIIKLLKLLKK